MEEPFLAILEKTLPDCEQGEELAAMGLPPTYHNAIRLQLVKKAAAGDLSAAKYVLEAVGGETPEGNPLEEVSTEELRKMVKRTP